MPQSRFLKAQGARLAALVAPHPGAVESLPQSNRGLSPWRGRVGDWVSKSIPRACSAALRAERLLGPPGDPTLASVKGPQATVLCPEASAKAGAQGSGSPMAAA